MDFVTHLPSTDSGFDAVWVVVDRFTKMVRFVPCMSTITAVQTASLFVKHIFKLHGMPKRIVSDRDNKFTSGFWRETMRLLGTTLNMSSGYHPQTDGQTELMDRTLEEALRAYCGAEHRHVGPAFASCRVHV
jgi:transposase InsO family protein